MATKAKFYVIDGSGHVSFDDDEPEDFSSRAAALKRARQLAESEPGSVIHVCKTVATVCSPVQDPVIEDVE